MLLLEIPKAYIEAIKRWSMTPTTVVPMVTLYASNTMREFEKRNLYAFKLHLDGRNLNPSCITLLSSERDTVISRINGTIIIRDTKTKNVCKLIFATGEIPCKVGCFFFMLVAPKIKIVLVILFVKSY